MRLSFHKDINSNIRKYKFTWLLIITAYWMEDYNWFSKKTQWKQWFLRIPLGILLNSIWRKLVDTEAYHETSINERESLSYLSNKKSSQFLQSNLPPKPICTFFDPGRRLRILRNSMARPQETNFYFGNNTLDVKLRTWKHLKYYQHN